MKKIKKNKLQNEYKNGVLFGWVQNKKTRKQNNYVNKRMRK